MVSKWGPKIGPLNGTQPNWRIAFFYRKNWGLETKKPPEWIPRWTHKWTPPKEVHLKLKQNNLNLGLHFGLNFESPKWCQNGSQNGTQNGAQNSDYLVLISKWPWKTEPKITPKCFPKWHQKRTIFRARERPQNHHKTEISSKWAHRAKMSPWDSKRPQNHEFEPPKSRKNIGKKSQKSRQSKNYNGTVAGSARSALDKYIRVYIYIYIYIYLFLFQGFALAMYIAWRLWPQLAAFSNDQGRSSKHRSAQSPGSC